MMNKQSKDHPTFQKSRDSVGNIFKEKTENGQLGIIKEIIIQELRDSRLQI